MSSSLPTTSLYADTAGVSSLKAAARSDSPEALREAARQFESLFTQMMLKSMREATFGDSLTGSDTTDFYQEMHDKQLAIELSKGRGLGLAEMLVQQLTRAGLVPGAASEGQRPVAGGQRSDSGTAAVESRSTSPTTDHRPLSTSSRADFIRQIRPYAEQAGRELGVDPNTLIAHAALETGWGRSIPGGADGASSFNLFGIKAGSRWQGATVGVSTLEYEAGLATRRVEKFRAYASPAECFKDYAALLARSDRYAAARDCGDDVAAFAQALQRGGYATDPNYARKLTAVADSLKVLLKSEQTRPLTAVKGES